MGQQAGGEPEALKHAQDSIETQLKEFGKDLWIYNDSTGVKKAIKPIAKSEKKRTKKEVKPKAGKSDKSDKSTAKPDSNSVGYE
ncbi:hypothetical protein FACS189413_18660 [Bacteroidia bacterium]|nr:hypothetical protein FACS189413_18660 [Bacteroidia bacterium]